VPAASGSVRTLVTGGAGFLGSHVVGQLLERGTPVAVVDDLSRGRREWVEGAEVNVGDIRDREFVARVVRDFAPDLVVHLAALHFIPAVDGAPDKANSINVDGTASVLAALGRVPRRVVFASTAAVYPRHDGPIPETLEAAPIDVYGRTKLCGERLLCAYARRTGSDVVLARLFNIVGRNETNPHVVPEIISQIASGASQLRLGNSEPRRDYIDASDVARALLHLARVAPGPVFLANVGTGIGTSVRDLVARCGKILDRELPIVLDPGRLRIVDRAELIADVSRLRGLGWKPELTLDATLLGLLVEAGAIDH
jgi:UDP-glucose 4-epimerase